MAEMIIDGYRTFGQDVRNQNVMATTAIANIVKAPEP
jgi:hypothetical protein